ncbi:hypothetical protein F4777DRAFT_216183 [Nemania sp. FL0916]|nr:hypothetical protein F4777DRAFT_216183 [Nemania sp. FL0916]
MNSLPRIPRGAFQSSAYTSWACASCRRAQTKKQWPVVQTARRSISQTIKRTQQQQAAHAMPPPSPSMERMREHYRYKNRTTMYAANFPCVRSERKRWEMGGMERKGVKRRRERGRARDVYDQLID